MVTNTNIRSIGNSTRAIGQAPMLALQTATKTRIFAERIVVPVAGTPIQFPQGKPVSDVRLSTAGNTGTIFLATSYVEAQAASHRFSVLTGSNISLPFRVTNLDEIWVNAATNNDAVSILTELESN